MPVPAKRSCANHGDRAAFAVCMTCRKAVCQECATQWDGIYHCTSCLAARRGATVRRSRVAGWIGIIGASLVLLYVSAHAMVWAGALLAGLF